MVRSALVTCLLLITVAYSDSLFLVRRYSVQPHRYVFSYHSSCKIISNDTIKSEMAEVVKHIAQEVELKLRVFPRSYELYQFENCVLQATRLEKIIERFPTALKRISRRSFVDDIFKDGVILEQVVKAMTSI